MPSGGTYRMLSLRIFDSVSADQRCSHRVESQGMAHLKGGGRHVRWAAGGGRAGRKGGAEAEQRPGEEVEGEGLVEPRAEAVGAAPLGQSLSGPS